jgi:DNA-directed RNA polymerase subunit beta
VRSLKRRDFAWPPSRSTFRTTLLGRFTKQRRIRKIFGNIHEISEMPNLIEVQRESYEQFLRSDPATGYVSGLEKTLRSVFPIQDFAGTAHLDFDRYELEPPKYDTDECRQRGLTYAAPMRVTLRLTSFEIDPETEAKSVIDIKEQDVYMGDMPLMTRNGTFIINGTERVIVSQMHRSPGVLFDHDRGKTHASGKYLFAARVIPYRGSWLDFEFDAKDIVNVRIDRKRKLPVTGAAARARPASRKSSTNSTAASSTCADPTAGRSPTSARTGAARSRCSTS